MSGASVDFGSAGSAINEVPSSVTTEDKLLITTGDEPHITFNRLVIDKKTGQILRHPSAEFYLEGKSLSGQPRSTWSLMLKRHGDEYVLGLAYSAAVVSGVDNIPSSWPEEVVELVHELAEIRNNCALPIIQLASQDPTHIKYIQSLLHDLQDEIPGRLLSSFRDGDDKAITEWDDLVEASRLRLPTADLPQSAIKYCFPSPEVAAIKLSAGKYLEYKWQESVMAGLSGGTEVTLVVVGVGLVLAFVKYLDRKQIEKKAQLDDHMTIQISINVDDSSDAEDSDGNQPTKEVKCRGKLASNRLGIKAYFSILLEKPRKDVFKLACRYGAKPMFMPAQVTIEEDRRMAKLEVGAVHSLCMEADNPHAKFQEMLLAEDAARAVPKNFLVDDVGCSPLEIQSITEAVIKKLVKAGTGKTTIIAALTEIYVRCADVGVLLCAPSNGNTGRIYDVVASWMALSGSKGGLDSNTQMPQRVYRAHLEEEYLLKTYDSLGTKSQQRLDEKDAVRFMGAADEVASDAAWYHRQIEADRRKAMNDATTGVTHAVVEAVSKNNLAVFTLPGTRNTQVQAAMTTFAFGLLKLKQIPYHKWMKKERNNFIRSWQTLARALVSRKRIVVCTAGNTVSFWMSEAFSDCKHVVIILDEASLCTDPALWNIIVNLFKSDRLESDYRDKTPVRAVVIDGDHHQGKAVIKSEMEAFNTFGQQLAVSTFVRAVMTGFPIEGMYEQFRMPEVLCALPNQRCYGGKLRIGATKKAKRPSSALGDFVIKYFETDLVPFSQIEDNEAREYAVDQYLRLQMLNVPSGQCQVEPHTQSRFNMANVDVAMKLFKELVINLVKDGTLKISEIKILTFYDAQKRRLINALVDLMTDLKRTADELGDVVRTSDSFQGQEADVVILDTTVCSYTGQGMLGHVGDELKFNVAATRAKECLFVIGNLKILDSEIIAEQERVEFVVELPRTLKKQRLYKNFDSAAKPEKIVGVKFAYQVEEEDEGEKEAEEYMEGDTAVEQGGMVLTTSRMP